MSAPNPDCPGCQALLARVAELEARLVQLEARLGQNSRNSSRPPSADLPRPPAPKPPQSGRKPGGQPGHPGRARELKGPQEVDFLVPRVPLVCAHCQTALPQAVAPTDPPPQRHQVVDLPLKLCEVTEYQLHARTCPACSRRTWAKLPAGAPPGVVGPRLQACCALLVGRYRLSRRDLREVLAEVIRAEFSLGCLARLETATTAALATAYAAAQAAVAAAPVVNVDETRWREADQKAWLWVAATPHWALFRLDPSRSRVAFTALLPKAMPGKRTVISDRYSVYRHLTGDEHQLCWSHLKRDFTALAELSDAAGAGFGVTALAQTQAVFHHWHAYRAGEIDQGELRLGLRPVQARLCRLLRRARDSGHWKAAGMARDLLRQWASLWTFSRVPGVEPTNNAAERAVRPAVLWRKNSFGNQSAAGRWFVERMLTVVGSLRLQGGKVLAYLEAAIRAQQCGTAAPELLPKTAAPAVVLPAAA